MQRLVLFMLIALSAAVAHAYNASGPFQAGGTPGGSVIVTDGGQTIVLGDIAHPLPVELMPAAAYTFDFDGLRLYSYRNVTTGETCSAAGELGAFAFVHDVPAVEGAPLAAVTGAVCIARGIAVVQWYFGATLPSTQNIWAITERQDFAGPSQRVIWIDLNSGAFASSVFIAPIGVLTIAPAGNVAMVQNDLNDGVGGPDFSFVDLCPNVLGSIQTTFHDLPGSGAASTVRVTSTEYRTRLAHPQLLGGEAIFSQTDCAALPPVAEGVHRLEVETRGSGLGIVTLFFGLIDCAGFGHPQDVSDCVGDITAGVSEGLYIRNLVTGSVFTGWGGDCSEFGDLPSVQLLFDRDRQCRAYIDDPAIQVYRDGFDDEP